MVSETHDLPLLLLVRNSGYIKHEQLLFLAGYDKSKPSLTCFFVAHATPRDRRICCNAA